MTTKKTTEELVAAVQLHARTNYNKGGWDFVVECYDRADIARMIGAAKTERGAIRNVAREAGISILAEQRTAIRNEIF